MYYSKKLKKIKKVRHCFFLEKMDFQKVFIKVLIVERDPGITKIISIETLVLLQKNGSKKID